MSHGICRDCLAIVMSGYGKSLAEFLQQLAIPIIVIDAQQHPVFDNRNPSQQLTDSGQSSSPLLACVVFDCACEEPPDGDNHSCDCLSCTLVKTTAVTYHTGVKQKYVAASPDLDSLAGISNPCYLISTEICEGTVLLSIEERKEID